MRFFFSTAILALTAAAGTGVARAEGPAEFALLDEPHTMYTVEFEALSSPDWVLTAAQASLDEAAAAPSTQATPAAYEFAYEDEALWADASFRAEYVAPGWIDVIDINSSAPTMTAMADLAAPAEDTVLLALYFQDAAAAGDASGQFESYPDPWQGLNRRVFGFNNFFDRIAFEPLARAYRAITPQFFRTSVSNFLNNLGEPVDFVNNGLQGQVKRAAISAGRFTINTTFGLLGFFDPASDLGLKRVDEDFGQTLAVWGMDSGPYLVLPFFGPSSLRDAIGGLVDMAFSPISYLNGEDIGEFRASRAFVGALSGRLSVLDQVRNIRNTSPDPYITFRSLYSQLRESQIRNGETDPSALPDFPAVEP